MGHMNFFPILLYQEREIEEKVTEEIVLFLSWKMSPVALESNFVAKQIGISGFFIIGRWF